MMIVRVLRNHGYSRLAAASTELTNLEVIPLAYQDEVLAPSDVTLASLGLSPSLFFTASPIPYMMIPSQFLQELI